MEFVKSLEYWFSILLLLVIARNHHVEAFGLDPVGNLFSSTKDVTTGVAKKLPDLIPKPNEIFEASKQVLAGYPFEVVSDAINTICSTALSSHEVHSRITPQIDRMQFQLRAGCEYFNFPLLEAAKMWTSPHFDVNKKVVILITGWKTSINETEAIAVLAKAFNCRGDVNFVALDSASYVDTLYSWSALNTEPIGEAVALGLQELIKHVPLERIHLIGHSLGAHICGNAGRHFQYLTNRTLPRISALDPAKPCFNEGEELGGLQRGDADFIDVIHSNPGVLGKRDSTGDVDFYPGGLAPLPAGCITVTCAHSRAWEYYAESVYPGNENNFMGVRCNSLTKLRQNKCLGAPFPMGYNVPHDIKGNYFLEVNRREPFGEFGNRERSEQNKECGACNAS